MYITTYDFSLLFFISKKWMPACEISMLSVVPVIHIISAGIPKPIFIKLGMYVTTTEHISTAYYKNAPPPAHKSVGLYESSSYHC
jgi:hypothetical protein